MDCKLTYLREKYEKTRSGSWFDPHINPDIQPIPECSVCQDNYDKYKEDGCPDYFKMNHTSSCLWYDYYVGIMKNKNKDLVVGCKYKYVPKPVKDLKKK